MTDVETGLVQEVRKDVKTLVREFTELRIAFERREEKEAACRSEVKALHTEVFGIDGNPDKPGLKGQMRDVKGELREHRKELDQIRSKYHSGLSKAWWAFITIVAAILGGIAGWFYPNR
jgi:hypothetical protein